MTNALTFALAQRTNLCMIACGLVFISPACAVEVAPPVVKMKNIFGETVNVQTYHIPANAVTWPTLTIAQRHYVWSSFKTIPKANMDVLVRCQIRADGSVSLASCEIVGDVGADAPERSAAIRLLYLGPILMSTFPMISDAQAKKISRLVSFPLRFDPTTNPAVDLQSGPLVEKALFANLRLPVNDFDYPPAALRAGAQGKLSVLCQVQTDFSLICAQQAFDPPENGHYFEGWAASLGRRAKISPNLTNGQSAAGVRTVFSINFRLPE